MRWLKPQSGALGKPQVTANKAYPALSDAPGTYVLES
jgi:poly(3-hydroxyalkanoate) synthetase